MGTRQRGASAHRDGLRRARIRADTGWIPAGEPDICRAQTRRRGSTIAMTVAAASHGASEMRPVAMSRP